MITTVTPNPSLDHTLVVPVLTAGHLHRATGSFTEASGKGVNVSLALRAAGVATEAVLPIGGPTGEQLRALLDRAGLAHIDVAISGAIRSNVSILELGGTTTKINEPGPTLTRPEVEALLEAAARPASSWVAWCGSLPLGFDGVDLTAGIARARACGTKVAVDTSDAALKAVLDQPTDRQPHLLKPNLEELSSITGRHVATPLEAATAALGLVRRGIETVLVSLGAEGALLVQQSLVLHGIAPVRDVVNTAGAGDALLAGFLAAEDCALRERLANALRFGAAAVQHKGTVLTEIDHDQQVEIRDLSEIARSQDV